jgi:membrane protein DedA with SNARE-associated domain
VTVFGIIGDLLSWVLGLVDTLGYPGLAIVVALENVFPPIPSEAVLPMAGYLVQQGRMTLLWATVSATVGSVLGALILYGLGYAWGGRRVRSFIKAYGRWAMVSEEDLDRSQEWFDHHGRIAVLIGRLAPLVRSVISIPAGVAKMPLGAFVLYTTIGSAIWNAALIGAGWLLGANWWIVERYQSMFGTAVVTLIALSIAWFVGRRLLAGGPSGHRERAGASK